jgi:hypothetical protein
MQSGDSANSLPAMSALELPAGNERGEIYKLGNDDQMGKDQSNRHGQHLQQVCS